MPHFRHHFSSRPVSLIFYPTFGQSIAVVSKQKGAILEKHGLPMISQKLRGESWAMCQPPRNPHFEVESMVRMPHFRYRFCPPPMGLIFSLNLENTYPRLAKRSHFGEKWIARDAPKGLVNPGQCVIVWRGRILKSNRG